VTSPNITHGDRIYQSDNPNTSPHKIITCTTNQMSCVVNVQKFLFNILKTFHTARKFLKITPNVFTQITQQYSNESSNKKHQLKYILIKLASLFRMQSTVLILHQIKSTRATNQMSFVRLKVHQIYCSSLSVPIS